MSPKMPPHAYGQFCTLDDPEAGILVTFFGIEIGTEGEAVYGRVASYKTEF